MSQILHIHVNFCIILCCMIWLQSCRNIMYIPQMIIACYNRYKIVNFSFHDTFYSLMRTYVYIVVVVYCQPRRYTRTIKRAQIIYALTYVHTPGLCLEVNVIYLKKYEGLNDRKLNNSFFDVMEIYRNKHFIVNKMIRY